MQHSAVQRSRPVLLLAILLLLVGVLVNLLWASAIGFNLTLWLWNLSPGLLSLAIWFLTGKVQRRKWIIVVPGILLTLLLIAYVVVFNVAGLIFAQATEPVTDVARYAEVRSGYADEVYAQHFPETIPSEATDAQFYLFRGFLQGGMHLQLRLQFPPEVWRDRSAQYAPNAQYRFLAGSPPTGDSYVPTTSFHTSDTDDRDFPDTYEILVFDAQSQGEPEWNHGYSYGVVLGEAQSEIIYWAEDW